MKRTDGMDRFSRQRPKRLSDSRGGDEEKHPHGPPHTRQCRRDLRRGALAEAEKGRPRPPPPCPDPPGSVPPPAGAEGNRRRGPCPLGIRRRGGQRDRPGYRQPARRPEHRQVQEHGVGRDRSQPRPGGCGDPRLRDGPGRVHRAARGTEALAHHGPRPAHDQGRDRRALPRETRCGRPAHPRGADRAGPAAPARGVSRTPGWGSRAAIF